MESFINVNGEFDTDSDILEKLKKGSEKSLAKKYEHIAENKRTVFESSPIVRLADFIIFKAINMGTSDIHMEPFEHFVLVRFRIDGILQEYTDFGREIYLSICSRIKLQANMDIAEKRTPQDGKMQFEYGEKH